MQDYITVTGIVIKTEPIGEYDRRVVILTREKGKISAFARAARKAGNRLMAPSNPFSFGQFRLYAGRNSYTMAEADISNYFELSVIESIEQSVNSTQTDKMHI